MRARMRLMIAKHRLACLEQEGHGSLRSSILGRRNGSNNNNDKNNNAQRTRATTTNMLIAHNNRACQLLEIGGYVKQNPTT